MKKYHSTQTTNREIQRESFKHRYCTGYSKIRAMPMVHQIHTCSNISCQHVTLIYCITIEYNEIRLNIMQLGMLFYTVTHIDFVSKTQSLNFKQKCSRIQARQMRHHFACDIIILPMISVNKTSQFWAKEQHQKSKNAYNHIKS